MYQNALRTTPRAWSWGSLAACGVLACLVTGGCVERQEHLKIDPDGAVSIHLEYEADSADELYVGRVPPGRYGWRIRRWTQDEGNGSSKYKLEAHRRIAFGEALPETYADPASGNEELFLAFPSTLTVELRDDGVYYHFERQYLKRDWAYLDDIGREVLAKENAQGLASRRTADLSDRERIALCKVMTRIETLKRLEMARRAYLTVTPNDSPDGWLRTRADTLATIEQFDYAHIDSILQAGSDTDAGQDAIRAVIDAYEAEIDGRILVDLLTYAGYTDSQATAFSEEYEWQKEYFQYTQDLNSEGFVVTVEMPGEIVSSNADSQEQDRAIWRFKGEWLHDRDRELLVTSRVRK